MLFANKQLIILVFNALFVTSSVQATCCNCNEPELPEPTESPEPPELPPEDIIFTVDDIIDYRSDVKLILLDCFENLINDFKGTFPNASSPLGDLMESLNDAFNEQVRCKGLADPINYCVASDSVVTYQECVVLYPVVTKCINGVRQGFATNLNYLNVKLRKLGYLMSQNIVTTLKYDVEYCLIKHEN